MAQQAVKRFYQAVSVAAIADGWQVLLDGRAIKSVAGAAQIVPSEALAQALAAEWSGQPAVIDPARFVLRDMADAAIDLIARDRAAAIAALTAYAETDTLCYRADPDEPLYKRQIAVWEPLLTAAEARHAVQFTRISGIIHRPQPAATLAAMHRTLGELGDFPLAGLRVLANLAGSLVIGLAALEPGADIAALWLAANAEEEWQAELWGREPEAEERRAARGALFADAVRFAALASCKTT